MKIKDAFRRIRAERGGFSIILATTLIAVILFMSIGLLSIVVIQRVTAQRYEMAVRTLHIADAGIQKAIHCLNAASGAECGGTYGPGYVGETEQPLGSGTFTTIVTGSGDDRDIESIGRLPSGFATTLRMHLNRRIGASRETVFDYAIQSVTDVDIQNNAEVHDGAIYTGGDVDCGNGVVIDNDIYVSKVGGAIDNCDIAGEAHADVIEKSDIGGDCYYDTTFQSSSCGGTEYPGTPTPAPRDMPEFDVDFWRSEALKGGVIVGDHSPADGSVLGPVKIDGDLTISNGGVVTMAGPVWVTGDVLLDNNSTLRLDPSFLERSSLILADSPTLDNLISIENNTFIQGSGTEGSYILFVSTAAIDPAIIVRNNAEAGIFYATSGSILLWNNSSVVAIAANGSELQGNAIINYDSSYLSDLSLQFVDIYDPWMLDPGTWREL